MKETPAFFPDHPTITPIEVHQIEPVAAHPDIIDSSPLTGEQQTMLTMRFEVFPDTTVFGLYGMANTEIETTGEDGQPKKRRCFAVHGHLYRCR
jgi:hypothetical protein